MNRKTKIFLLIIVVLVIAVIVAVAKHSAIDSDQLEQNTEPFQNTEVNQNDDISEESGATQELEVTLENPVESIDATTKKADASYEEWLAAGMIVSVSMKYSEFELQEIYLASDTELNNHDNSLGAYVVFICNGKEVVVHSRPIDKERTESGTIDIFSINLGYATFEEVEKKTVDMDSMIAVSIDSLSQLIEQSMLVSVYER